MSITIAREPNKQYSANIEQPFVNTHDVTTVEQNNGKDNKGKIVRMTMFNDLGVVIVERLGKKDRFYNTNTERFNKWLTI